MHDSLISIRLIDPVALPGEAHLMFRDSRSLVPFVVLMIWTAWGCSSDADLAPEDGGADAPALCTEALWQPGADELYRWPESSLVQPDETTETGYRLSVPSGSFASTVERLAGFAPVLTEDLNELDGFGLNADIFFTFGAAFDDTLLPSGDITADGKSGLGLIVIEPGPPRIIPVSTYTGDEGRTLFLRPMQPLPPKALMFAYLTTSLRDATLSRCLQVAPSFRERLAANSDELLVALEALSTLGVASTSEEIVAFSLFPTQSLLEDNQAVQAHLSTQEVTWEIEPTCTVDPGLRRCEAAVSIFDYRDERGVFQRSRGAGVAPSRRYSLPVTLWLPLEEVSPPPYPSVLFGHGLNDSPAQANSFAAAATSQGIAVVAASTLYHGDHPTADPDAGDLQRVMAFFAVDLPNLPTRVINSLELRDNFRQTAWERQQLVNLLASSPRVDGDAAADIDGTKLGYVGYSLGGIQGPQLLASTDSLGVAILAVPGGKIISIIGESQDFGSLVAALRPPRASASDLSRFFPILQTVVDQGDACSYGPYVQRQRAPSSTSVPPSVLLGMALDDRVVPNVSNFALGRAMGIPIVEPVLLPEDGFAVLPSPLSGNIAGGLATGGYLQFDRVLDDAGSATPATHVNTPASELAFNAWFHFLNTHWVGGLAEIRNPYEATGFPR